MAKRRLTAVSRGQGNNRALKAGEVTLPDYDLVFEEVDPLVRAFRRMVREQAWDVTEMALTTYITAKAHGVPITAVPVFLVRGFHHGAIVAGAGSDVAAPDGLRGREVGVKRGYTVTTGVWARAILDEEWGIGPGDATWVRSGDEHVADWRPPANVTDLGEGETLEGALASGRLAGAVGLTAGEGLRALVADPFEAGRRALTERGFYPINHTVAIRDDLIAEEPDLPRQVFEAFAASKRRYVEALRMGHAAGPGDRVYRAAMEVLGDPLPYGIAPNLATLEGLMDHAVRQGILETPLALETLFAEGTRELTG